MHELAVTENVLNIACKHAEEANADKVTDIYLTIGQLSSIVDDSIMFYWEIISKDTLCQKAKVHFNRIPAELQCQSCDHQYTMGSELRACPKCKSAKIKVLSGDEFHLESIEIQR